MLPSGDGFPELHQWRLPRTQRFGLFVPKPSSYASVVRILAPSLGLSVRQRPLVYVGVCGDRHSVGHSAKPLGPTLACPSLMLAADRPG